MAGLLKRVASRFPSPWRQELKRHYYAWQIGRGEFLTDEREYQLLDLLLSPGDWVLDIGANVGHYAARMSQLVGPTGRVVAFEPVPRTFELLAHNARHFPFCNVTLFNMAASSASSVVGMDVPTDASGHENGYLAHIAPQGSGLQVLCMPVDSLALPGRVTLVKIDAEGHEVSVLEGMKKLLSRDRPTLIVELGTPAAAAWLLDHGYEMQRLAGSPNGVFMPGAVPETSCPNPTMQSTR